MAYDQNVPAEGNVLRTAAGDIAKMRENFQALNPIVVSGLNGLSGVNVAAPADGQFLRFDLGASSWVASGALDEFVKNDGDVISGELTIHAAGTSGASETTGGSLKTFDLMLRHSETANHPALAMLSDTDLNGRSPQFFGLRARGTSAARLAVSGGEDCLLFFGHGWNGTEYTALAGFSAQADGPASAGVSPGRMVFFAVGSGSGSPLDTHMVMRGDGRVAIGSGIGNDFEPIRTLHVSGGTFIDGDLLVSGTVDAVSGVFAGTVSLRPDSTLANLALNFSDDTDTGIFSSTAGRLSFAVDGAEIARFDTAGGQKNLLLLVTGNAANPALQINDADTGFFRAAADTLSLAAGGVELTRWHQRDADDDFIIFKDRIGINLGISTPPSHTLHVVGSGLIDGDLFVSGAVVTSADSVFRWSPRLPPISPTSGGTFDDEFFSGVLDSVDAKWTKWDEGSAMTASGETLQGSFKISTITNDRWMGFFQDVGAISGQDWSFVTRIEQPGGVGSTAAKKWVGIGLWNDVDSAPATANLLFCGYLNGGAGATPATQFGCFTFSQFDDITDVQNGNILEAPDFPHYGWVRVAYTFSDQLVKAYWSSDGSRWIDIGAEISATTALGGPPTSVGMAFLSNADSCTADFELFRFYNSVAAADVLSGAFIKLERAATISG